MSWLSRIFLAGALLACAAPGWSQTALEATPFDETTWAGLASHGARPAAYLFTTSYCSTCPDAFEVLRKAVQQSGRAVPLAVVMMDIEGEQAVRHAHYFAGLTRLYAFDGFEPGIRQSVDPQWQNITPYIVLVDRQGSMQRMLGAPPPGALARWLKN